MSTPCPTCLPVDCSNFEDSDLYSIQSPIFGFVFNCPPGFTCGANNFEIVCCGQLLSVQIPVSATVDERATLIQGVLNQCGVRQLYCGDLPQLPPGTPVQLYYNVPKQCTVVCPDGSPFVYTVAAGVFLAATQAEADANAASFACVQAGLRRVCLGSIPGCACVGSSYSATIATSGGIAPFTWGIASGSFPPGMTLNGFGVISGTPTTPGTYAFTIKVTEPDGSNVQKSFHISCLQITTASLPAFMVGVPYSTQLAATGGSGNYRWAITSGTLPDGLTMTIGGLISGTPSVSASSASLTFEMIDAVCETATRLFFPPVVKLVTTSQTKIATVLGVDEYIPSTPPKRYRTVTWDGHSEHQLWYYPGPTAVQIAGARFEYSGSSTIDLQGNYTSLYRKDFSAMCTATGSLYTSLLPGVNGGLDDYIFSGWLGPAGHEKCSLPGIPYAVVGNFAIGTGQASRNDSSALWGSKKPNPGFNNAQVSNFQVVNATEGACVDSNTDLTVANSLISLFEPLPLGTVTTINGSTAGIVWFFSPVLWDHNYSCILSDEYTDADALSVARTINGNGATAQNLPRTTGFVSSFTTVAFTLKCSNLISSQDYTVSYDLLDQTAGTTTTVQVPFTAAATTFNTTGSVPTPIAGHSVTIRNVRIAFSP